MMEDNWSRQADEIEALSSIFCEQFSIDDPVAHKYSIKVTDGLEKPRFEITLQVTFSPDYPSDAPPTYQINAPWLRGREKTLLQNNLEEIYSECIGESIVYIWTERIREFLRGKSDALEGAESPEVEICDTDIHEGRLEKGKPVTEESKEEGDEEYDEYGFDPTLHAFNTETVPDVPDSNEYDIQLPPIHHGEFLKDRKSVFQGHLAPINHKKQVEMVLNKLKENKKIAQATHNIIAYRIDAGNDVFITGCVDDGETHAGSRMLHLLNIVDATNVLVIVTRWYGGVHLGPDRFKHISNITREMLDAHGYIKDKATEKKGPKSREKESQATSQSHRPGHSQRHGKKGK